VTRATTRGENHQPRSSSPPRLGDSTEREPWELTQNQPGQVDTMSEENDLDKLNELEGAAGRENLHLGPPKGRSIDLESLVTGCVYLVLCDFCQFVINICVTGALLCDLV